MPPGSRLVSKNITCEQLLNHSVDTGWALCYIGHRFSAWGQNTHRTEKSVWSLCSNRIGRQWRSHPNNRHRLWRLCWAPHRRWWKMAGSPLRTGVQEGGAERNRAPPAPGFPLHGARDACSPPVVLRRPLWHRGMCVSWELKDGLRRSGRGLLSLEATVSGKALRLGKMGDAQGSESRPAWWLHRSSLHRQWCGGGSVGRGLTPTALMQGTDAGSIHWIGPGEAMLGDQRGRWKSFDFISWHEDIHKRWICHDLWLMP